MHSCASKVYDETHCHHISKNQRNFFNNIDIIQKSRAHVTDFGCKCSDSPIIIKPCYLFHEIKFTESPVHWSMS